MKAPKVALTALIKDKSGGRQVTVPRYATILKTPALMASPCDIPAAAGESISIKSLATNHVWQRYPGKLFSGLVLVAMLSACSNNSSDSAAAAPAPSAPSVSDSGQSVDEKAEQGQADNDEPGDDEPVDDSPVAEGPPAQPNPETTPETTPPPEASEPLPDLAGTLFDLGVVLDVDIQMTAEGWQALANDGRDRYRAEGAPCFPGYTWYTGTVTIQGETHDDVAIRKKGNWSADSRKPALKLDYGKGEYDDRVLQGERRFTFNNNVQDGLHIKQCLSYSLFADAGVHAPRCNFATVTAQSRELGVYTNVEPINKPFLEHSFGNKSGNLYEASGNAAFIESRVAYFEIKTNEDQPDRAALMAVVDAMQVADDQLWDEMNKVINLDNFINFAAMEALVGHVDGFTSFNNNAYIYQNPDDNRLYFIPWGTDQTFRAHHILDRTNETPASIQRGSHLTRRLWESETFRTRYDARLRELLDTVWDEAAIKARAAYMGGLIGMSPGQLRSLNNFIDQRREKVEAELAGDADRLGNWVVTEPADAPPVACSMDEDGKVVAL